MHCGLYVRCSLHVASPRDIKPNNVICAVTVGQAGGDAGAVLCCGQSVSSSGSLVTGQRPKQCRFNSYQRKKSLSVCRTVQNSPRTQPASYPVGIEGYPRRLNWSEREATHFLMVPKVKKRPNYTFVHDPRPTYASS